MTAMAERDELFVEDDRRTWVGLVLGLWLVGVFAGALFGNVEGRRSHMYEAIMLASLLWPVGYFLFSRSRFVPEGFNPGTIASLMLFGLFCGLSSFVSHAPLGNLQPPDKRPVHGKIYGNQKRNKEPHVFCGQHGVYF